MAAGCDVVILGGGVIGLTAAYVLAKAGIRVRLLDRGDFGQEASWAGAGILPPANCEQAVTPLEQLRALSVGMFPQLSYELKERIGIDNGYLISGGLELIGHSQSAGEEWGGAGVEARHLTEAEARANEPALASGLGNAIFLPGMAQLRNPWHLRALVAACQSLGVVLSANQAVQGFKLHGPRLLQVETDAGPVDGELFVACVGAWTDRLLARLGLRLGIEPVRGQIVQLNPGRVLLRRILLRGAQYLVPRGDGRVLAGSTEEAAGFEKRNTAAGVEGLLTLALRLVPSLADAAVEKAWSGLRPGSPDGLPFIGPVPGMENVMVAAGHFRAGIQHSPGTAMLVKSWVLRQAPAVDINPFRLDRSSS
jgi:glycine oxidase